MKCTACGEGRLNPSFLDALFRCHTCDNCGGNWILIEDYVAWWERNTDYPFQPVDVESQEIENTERALVCPVTGTLMSKFRILSNNPHRLDYSPRVGGVWLDKGEWELLKNEGLAGSLNVLLTEPWQQKIRADQTRATFDQLYRGRFGEADYEKAQAIRAWLQDHPLKAELRSYLLTQDPYSAK